MRSVGKIASAVLLGFLVFAPPGTMIAIGIVLIWLFGSYWPLAIAGLLSIVVVFARIKRNSDRSSSVHSDNSDPPTDTGDV